VTLEGDRSFDLVSALAFALGAAVIIPSLVVAGIAVATVLVKLFA